MRTPRSGIVIVQKRNQHAAEWDVLAVEEQAMIMGRTKPDSIEIPDMESLRMCGTAEEEA